jgi:hypothetical protein
LKTLARVSFDEVLKTFATNHSDPEVWARARLRTADSQRSEWTLVELGPQDVLAVWLPHHRHGPEEVGQGLEVVSPEGSTVADTIETLSAVGPNPCVKRIDMLSSLAPTPVYLSADPIDHQDYAGLVRRKVTGLVHLDGLHRLVAWGRVGQGATAYVCSR